MPLDIAELDALAKELGSAMPRLTPSEQTIALSVYRLLAGGQPVTPAAVARHAGAHEFAVLGALDSWPGAYRRGGDVIGFWGLTVEPMAHRLEVDGEALWAWCAWDTLFLPELIGRPAGVASACPVTGEAIALAVDPAAGVRDLQPGSAVLSLLRPDEPFDADMIASFCHYVHFVRDSDAASGWIAEHPGTFTMSVEEGFELGRLTNRAKFGDALERGN